MRVAPITRLVVMTSPYKTTAMMDANNPSWEIIIDVSFEDRCFWAHICPAKQMTLEKMAR